MKKTQLILLGCAGFALLLPMCQQSTGLLAAGSVVAVDAQADALLQQARGHIAQGNARKARSLLQKILSRHSNAPCVPEAHCLLGDVHAALGDYREAFKQYGKVVEGYQSSPLYTTAINRQLAMATEAASGELKVGMFYGLWKGKMDSDVVKDWLRSIVKNAPYNEMSATAMSVLGRYLYGLGEFENACMVFSKLAEDYPGSKFAPEAQLMVAQIWAASCTRGNNNSLVNLNKAQEAYEEFTLRFPHHPDAKKALAQVSNMKRLLVQQQLDVGRYYLERSREYRAAAFCFEDVIRHASENPEAAAVAQRLLPEARSKMSSAR